ncbi:zinc-binding dehydrogenase [Corynebacterium tapiri]|uniref:enoyl-[acyl-carrier-protein] reductase n=1 Tax=Corynebacterium tapiri TaxID=1448266 RepID=A0A5C4U2J8_9CORY|nr:zinc-binding dehydrogenase [Corynebacterium tapiri]TNL96775.1 zinc-binding dehydrogenase [Corynebacterium tapiri]
MRTIMHDTFGKPEEVLYVDNQEIPEPEQGQVRLKVVLSSIHNHDLETIRGRYGFVPPLPAHAGTEAVGIVDKLGAGVEGLSEGQRVVSGGSFGVWSEYAVVDAAKLIPVPDALPDEVAAQLVAMPFSAISLLDSLNLESGDWLILNAANGAVGRIASQLAQGRGINVVGLVRRDAAIDELAEHGVTKVVSTEGENWRERVQEITGGAPIKAGLDSVGGQATADLVSLLGDGGTLVAFGAMNDATLSVPVQDVLFRGVSLRGFWGSKVNAEMTAEKRAELFGELIARISDGTVTLPVAGTFDVDNIREAVEACKQAGRNGKVLLSF